MKTWLILRESQKSVREVLIVMYLNYVCCINEWMLTQDFIVLNPVVVLNVHIKRNKKNKITEIEPILELLSSYKNSLKLSTFGLLL